MRKPDQSLEDFFAAAAPENPAEPPPPVSLRFTGEVEVLKPLARAEHEPVDSHVIASDGLATASGGDRVTVETPLHPAPHGLSWFHRSLAVGGGLAVIAFLLVGFFLIGMRVYDLSGEPVVSQTDTAGDEADIPADRRSVDKLLPAEAPFTSDTFTMPSSQPENPSTASSKRKSRSNRFDLSQSAFRLPRSSFRLSARPRPSYAAYRPRYKRPRSLSFVSTFVPTTLVIFIENGHIKTRVEPWLTNGYKKPQALSN